MTTFPQHRHPLVLTNPQTVYPQYNGQWKCDICDISYDNQHTPYHCSICSFDLCETCSQSKQHPRHDNTHNLYHSKMTNIYPQFNGVWKCDGCDQTKTPLIEPNAYHCYQDEFDLCSDCFKGRRHPIHIHPLIPADAHLIYGSSPGLWVCDICKRNAMEIGTAYPWHCSECEFDCCHRCRQEIVIPNHQHRLRITDSRLAYPDYLGSWKCDICRQDFSPNAPGDNTDKPYHCFTCEFDACHNCVNQALGGGDNF